MALLQNTSDNIVAPGDSEEAEIIKRMESSSKAELDLSKANEQDAEIASMEAEETVEKKDEKLEENVEKDAPKSSSKERSPIVVITDSESMEKKESPVKESPSKKSSIRKESKKKENQENVEELAEEKGDEAEPEKHEEKKGIFDMPLEVEGKRERHKVERISIGTPVVRKPPSEMKMGNGVPLGEIAYIEDQLKKHSAGELQIMHRLIYGHVGKASTIRREIRKFTGFAFEEDTPEFKHKIAFLQKLNLDQLKILKKILGLQSGGNTKEALVTTIMVFMMKTVDHERKVPSKKRRSTAKTPSTAKRQRKLKGSDETVDDDDEDEEEEEEKEKEKEKTPKRTPKRPVTAKRLRKKTDSETKDTPAKMESDADSGPAKKKSKKITKKDSGDDTSSNTSEETSQENNPSEKELEDVIEELLSTFDLAQVSMKQMCQAVIERFPGTNIGNRVDFLKSKIKQALSTK